LLKGKVNEQFEKNILEFLIYNVQHQEAVSGFLHIYKSREVMRRDAMVEGE